MKKYRVEFVTTARQAIIQRRRRQRRKAKPFEN
jgi:hypothetical protein